MSAQKAGELLHIFYFLSICEGIINSCVKKKKKSLLQGLNVNVSPGKYVSLS